MKRIFEIEWPEDRNYLYIGLPSDRAKDITNRARACVPRRWLLGAYLAGAALANTSTPVLWGGFAALALGLYLWHMADRNGWGR